MDIETITIENEPDKDRFKTLTEAYETLVKASNRISEIKDRIDEDFRKTSQPYSFSNPFEYGRANLQDVVNEARINLTKFLTRQMEDEYRKINIEIDGGAVLKFVSEKGYFNHEEIIGFIRQKYHDTDAEALRQIIERVKDLLPVGNFGDNRQWTTANRPDHIKMSGNNAGIELRIRGSIESNRVSNISVFIKLVDIALNGTRPIRASGGEVKEGTIYRDANIKSLRYFKNRHMKVIFFTVQDAEKMKEAIFTPSSSCCATGE